MILTRRAFTSATFGAAGLAALGERGFRRDRRPEVAGDDQRHRRRRQSGADPARARRL